MATKAIRVLLIEDNEGDARLVRSFLEEQKSVPIELDHVRYLSAGLARLTRNQFDAVLLDLRLPDSTGLDTFRLVFQQSPEVPIVVLTGLEEDQLALQAMRAGAEDHFCKGWLEPPLLVRTIRHAIERAERRRAEASFDEASRESERLWENLFFRSHEAAFGGG